MSRTRKYYFPNGRRALLSNAVVVIARTPLARFGTTLCKCGRASPHRLCTRKRCLLSVNWTLCHIPLLCLFSTLFKVDLDFHISCRVAVPDLVYFTRAIHSAAYNADQRYLARIIGPPRADTNCISRKRIRRWRWSMIVHRLRTSFRNRNDSRTNFSHDISRSVEVLEMITNDLPICTGIYQLTITWERKQHYGK